VKVDQDKVDLALIERSKLKIGDFREKYREKLGREFVLWRVRRVLLVG
jgi:hypothetical protein